MPDMPIDPTQYIDYCSVGCKPSGFAVTPWVAETCGCCGDTMTHGPSGDCDDDTETGVALGQAARAGQPGSIQGPTPGYRGDHDLGVVYEVQVLEENHVNYPHEPGRLYDCPACEARCHCDDDPGHTACIFDGEHNFGKTDD